GSEIMPSHADCSKVQDAYSLRCMPQVHGTFRGALSHVQQVVEIELNAAADNPLVFPDTNEVIAGGNFHGQPVALPADLSTPAARKCGTAVTNATRVLACELLCAAQGWEFHLPLRPGRGVERAYRQIRDHGRPLRRDRTLHRDL